MQLKNASQITQQSLKFQNRTRQTRRALTEKESAPRLSGAEFKCARETRILGASDRFSHFFLFFFSLEKIFGFFLRG